MQATTNRSCSFLRNCLPVFTLCLLIAPLAHAQDLSAKLNEYMDAAAKVEDFSGSVLVAKDSILLSKGYGMANHEWQIPCADDTKFRLGSITKQFTAMAILILEEQGKLKTTDKVAQYVDSPKTWEKVTIHHLLTHTSGIPSFTDDANYRRDSILPRSTGQIIDRFRDKGLSFQPGEKFHYNNSGYFLLGAIIEKASGKKYDEFIKSAILDPLSLSETGYDKTDVILPKRASGYVRSTNGLRNAPYIDMSQPFAAGALYSTVKDLYKWDQALDAGKLISSKSYEKMYTPFRQNYAYGWGVDKRGSKREISHGGSINGFSTDIRRIPEDKICVVVLSNEERSNAGKISRELLSILLNEPYQVPRARSVVKLDTKILDRYVGKYNMRPGFDFVVTRDGDRLFVQATGQRPGEIFAESEKVFFAKVVAAEFRFEQTGDAKATALELTQRGRKMVAKRVN